MLNVMIDNYYILHKKPHTNTTNKTDGIYTTICKIDSQWEFTVWLRELKPGLCDNLGVGVGEGFTGRGHMYTMADS